MKKLMAKDFCKLTGLTSHTLRFYVDSGLLNPTVNEMNNYKEYTTNDVVDYYYIKLNRFFQIPIRNILDSIDNLSLAEQKKYLEDYHESLIDEKRALDQRIQGCKKIQRDIASIPNMLENVIETEGKSRPNQIHMDLIGPGIQMDKSRTEMLNLINELNLHSFSYIRIPKEELLDDSIQQFTSYFGIGIAIKNEENIKLYEKPCFVYPTHDAVIKMVRVQNPFAIERKDIQTLLDYIALHQMKIVNDLTSWLVTKSKEEGVVYYYFAIRISVDR